MLVTRQTKTGELSVQQICDHLGVERWVVRRLVTDKLRNGVGIDGKLVGRKEKGPGKLGQSGQWVFDLRDYLNWLGIPASDRKVIGDDGLPVLTSFAAAAERMGITEPELRTLVDVNGLNYILLVQGRPYLTAGQLAAVQAKRKEVAAQADSDENPGS